MIQEIDIVKSRKIYAESRIQEFRTRLDQEEDFPRLDDLCIYLTGSYGRLEASQYSDLDIFFIHLGSGQNDAISGVDKTLMDASLIKISRYLDFPEFTKGGLYLEIHYLDEIRKYLGGQEDDYRNLFTARMLLLLESVPIFNPDVYAGVLEKIIDSYYRDYHDHDRDFRPIFLVNDIQRYWKTMCLNYEHIRNLQTFDDPVDKNKIHLKNFKLKFSRLLTCYSMIISILLIDGPVGPSELLEIIHRKPLERLDDVVVVRPELKAGVDDLGGEYAWFLEIAAKSEAEVQQWIGDKAQRNKAFDRARGFGDSIHRLVLAVTEGSDKLRYLVV